MAHTQTSKTQQNTGEGRGSGHRGPAKGFAFGVAAVTQVLEGTHFPVSKQELIRRHGKEELHWTKDSKQTLGEILKPVPTDEFQSIADVAAAVSEAHKSGGQ